MGTVLSLSPGSRKATPRGWEKLSVQKPPEPREDEEKEEEEEDDGKRKKKKQRHPVLLHALSWKKRLVAARAKRKGGKKVKPAVSGPGHVQREQAATDSRHRALKAGHRHGPIPVPVPTVPPEHTQNQNQGRPELIISPRRVVVQASTGELLRCLSDFLCHRCVKLMELSSNQIVLWFRNIDRTLLVQGWQDQCFISPASVVFVYLLCREAVDEDTSSEQELQATFLTCLYLGYSYLGNEISYPLKPFLVESSRDAFWERALELIERLSTDMLRINTDPHFFTEMFQDLKSQGRVMEKPVKEKEREQEERQKTTEKMEEKENDVGNRNNDLDFKRIKHSVCS